LKNGAQRLNWAGARRSPAPTPMIWAPPPVVETPLHPNGAPVPSFPSGHGS